MITQISCDVIKLAEGEAESQVYNAARPNRTISPVDSRASTYAKHSWVSKIQTHPWLFYKTKLTHFALCNNLYK